MYGFNGPQGFVPVRSLSSSNPFNAGLETYTYLFTNLSCYKGDVVSWNPLGTIYPMSNTYQDSSLQYSPIGVAHGFSYVTQSYVQYQQTPNFPGRTLLAPNTEVTAFVIVDPFQVYTIQTNGNPGVQLTNTWQVAQFTAANVVANAGQALVPNIPADATFATGNSDGTSTQVLAQSTLSSTPGAPSVMRVLGLTIAPNNAWYVPGQNTIGYNNVNVMLCPHGLLNADGV